MEIIEVSTASHESAFIQLPVRLYKGEKNWIRPLDKDVKAVFNPKENKYFRHGECTRFLAYQNNKVVGRVAVFIVRKSANKQDQPTGGMGFFECENKQEIDVWFVH